MAAGSVAGALELLCTKRGSARQRTDTFVAVAAEFANYTAGVFRHCGESIEFGEARRKYGDSGVDVMISELDRITNSVRLKDVLLNVQISSYYFLC